MNTQKTKWLLMFSIVMLTTFASAGFCDNRIVWSTIDGGGTSAGGQNCYGGNCCNGKCCQPGQGF